MIGVVQALDALRGVHDRGFRFSGAKGPGEDLLLSFDQLRTEALKRADPEMDGTRRGLEFSPHRARS